MSARHRSFTTKPPEPLGFDIDGEEFTCFARIPGGTLLDIATAATSAGAEIGAIAQFFEMTIIPEDQERFAKLIRSEKGPDLVELRDIIMYLVEEYSNFPTGSSGSSSTTGTGSEENASSPESG